MRKAEYRNEIISRNSSRGDAAMQHCMSFQGDDLRFEGYVDIGKTGSDCHHCHTLLIVHEGVKPSAPSEPIFPAFC